ncbi:MAG TPA: hypothetical protein DDW28_11055 [Prevotella sp.]|nr:hypothetical protein [uncultured Prevotella sp.]HBF06576.1 hypothetical protein [Candidatus Segatella violae]
MTETKEEKALRFKQLCISILAQSGNCQDSQRDFDKVSSIKDMCDTWHKYWHGMITEVPQQVVQAFKDFYPDFKAEINAAGIFYNEDSRTGYVLVGDSDEPIHLSFAHTAYVLGQAHVVLHLQASALAMNPDCKIELLDNSRATIKDGYAIAKGYSQLTTGSDAECSEHAVVRITNGTLRDRGHNAIYAYGKATINSFTSRLITLYDEAKLNIKK